MISTVPILAICRYWNKRDSIRPISGTGIPVPVRGSASFGTGIRWSPYRNWALCAGSQFRYGALPVPVLAFVDPRTGTGLCALDPSSGTGLCQFRYFSNYWSLLFIFCSASGEIIGRMYNCDWSAQELKNNKNEEQSQYWKWDLPFLELVPVLETAVPFPELGFCQYRA